MKNGAFCAIKETPPSTRTFQNGHNSAGPAKQGERMLFHPLRVSAKREGLTVLTGAATIVRAGEPVYVAEAGVALTCSACQSVSFIDDCQAGGNRLGVCV